LRQPKGDDPGFMARPRLSVCILAIATLAAAMPARAQFGSIFSDSPPRPPANVPNAPPADERMMPPTYPPSREPPPYYPSRERVPPRPPADARSDVPPAQPLPAPMSLPPSSRPGAGAIQSQDLAAPPGTEPPAQPGVANTAPQTLPGLPPGQRQPRGAGQPADTAPLQPGDEVVVAPPPQRINNPTAVFSGLDKITGRIISFDVAINETVQFGALQVTPRVCYSRPPTENPNTDAFIEVDEVTLQGEIKRIFNGWMFAASPGLHAVEHPIYDVWLTDCKGAQQPAVAEAPADAPKPARTQPQRRATPPAQRAPQPAPPPQQPRAQQQQPGFLPALR
jgi:hypothetical protein